MGEREDRDYYSRKSLEDSMKTCGICLICLIAMLIGLGIYQIFR